MAGLITPKGTGGYYGAQDVTEQKYAHAGFTYKTSKALIENVICKRVPNLFSYLEEGIATTEASQKYIDQNSRKPVSLTPFQLKLITAFAQVVDTQLPKDNVNAYIDGLTSEKIQARINNNYKELKGRVSAVVDITELAKLVYGKQRIGGKQTDKVREEITALSQIRQEYRLKDGKGGTLILETPLIHLGKTLRHETQNGVERLNMAEIVFEDVFVYEIKDRYSLAPLTLLKLWNETGVNTELFATLLFLLQQERGFKVGRSMHAADALRKELNKKKLPEGEKDKKIAECRREQLTYKETFISICERLNDKTTYYQTRKGKSYLRYERVKKDLKQAQEALIRMGIISDYFESTTPGGDLLCNFVINPEWLTQETDKIKAQLPPEEKKKYPKEEKQEEA